MEEVYERWLGIQEYHERRISDLHEFAEDWQLSGGMHVDYETFVKFLMKEGDFESVDELCVDNCYVHRFMSSRGMRFKTMTTQPLCSMFRF